MTDLRQAAQQALEALQNCANGEDDVLLTRDALAALRAALAEPQEPDSPERRCGGPGCDMKCCQPVQEPVAWECKAGGLRRLTQRQYEAQPDNIKRHYTRIEPVQEPVAWTLTRTLTERKTTTNGYLWFSDPVNSSWTPLYTSPPQRKPLTDEEIERLWYPNAVIAEPGKRRVAFGRAVERAHGIGGEG